MMGTAERRMRSDRQRERRWNDDGTIQSIMSLKGAVRRTRCVECGAKDVGNREDAGI